MQLEENTQAHDNIYTDSETLNDLEHHSAVANDGIPDNGELHNSSESRKYKPRIQQKPTVDNDNNKDIDIDPVTFTIVDSITIVDMTCPKIFLHQGTTTFCLVQDYIATFPGALEGSAWLVEPNVG